MEFDVRLSRDGHPILFHDQRLERTTNGRGRVADRDLADLKRLDAGAWFGRHFRGEPIPTLVEALATAEALGLGINVEIKPDRDQEAETARAAIEVMRSAWPHHLPRPVISSFRPRAAAVAAAAAPDYEHALLVETVPRDWRRRLDALGGTALHCDARRLRRDMALQVIAAGVPLRCYTVNGARLARRLFAWGVEAVFTDDPMRLGALRKPPT